MTQPAEIHSSPVPSPAAPPMPAAVGVSALRDLPEDQLTSAFKTGALGFRANERVPIRMPDGKLGTIGAEEIVSAVDAGAEIVHPDVVRTAEIEAKYGGVGGALGAGVAGAARGASIGLSDPVALAATRAFAGPQAAESLRERLAGYKEVHPIATTVGEIAGIAAPALFSGGAAAVPEGAGLLARGARALGAGTEIVGAVGKAAEGVAARVVGREAENVAVRAAQKAVAKGVSGAAEAAVFGAGQEVSEASLDPNHELTAEKVLASMGHAAVLGGLVSGGLGAAGELAKPVIDKVRAKASPYLAAKAEESAFKALNGRVKFVKMAEKIPGGARGVARTVLDKVGLEAGDTVETIAPKVDAALDQSAGRITAEVEKVGKATITLKEAEEALEARAKQADAVLGHEAEANAIRGGIKSLRRTFVPFEAAAEKEATITVPAHLEAQRPAIDALWAAAQKPGGEEAMQTLQGMGVQVTMPKPPVPFDPEKVKIPLADLLQQRRAFEATVDFQREGSIVTNGKRAVGRTLEDLIVSRGEQAAKESGLAFEAPYKAAKLEWRQLKVASDAVNDAVDRAHANASHSLTDKLMAGHGMSGGIMHGIASGHLLAGGVHGVVAGAVAGQASKLLRTKGPAAMAVWFDKLSQLQSIARRTDQVDAQIARGVKGFMRRASGAEDLVGAAEKPKVRLTTISRGKETPREEYERRVADVKAAAAGVDHAPVAEGIARHAPMTAAALTKRSQEATAWLASQAPEPPKFGSKTPTPHEVHEFNAKARAVDDPVGTIVGGLAEGGLTKTQVDAVKATSPALYSDFQKKIDHQIQAAVLADKAIPWQVKRDLFLLFDETTMWSTTAGGVKQLQDNTQVQPDKQRQGPKPGPGGAGARRKSMSTPGATSMQAPSERQAGELR